MDGKEQRIGIGVARILVVARLIQMLKRITVLMKFNVADKLLYFIIFWALFNWFSWDNINNTLLQIILDSQVSSYTYNRFNCVDLFDIVWLKSNQLAGMSILEDYNAWRLHQISNVKQVQCCNIRVMLDENPRKNMISSTILDPKQLFGLTTCKHIIFLLLSLLVNYAKLEVH